MFVAFPCSQQIAPHHLPLLSFHNIALIRCSNLFISSLLIQELPRGILARQNAVLCRQMIPQSATTAAGQQKRSHISH